MRVDAHQHYWAVARGDYGWLTPQNGMLYQDYGPEDLAPHLERHGIAKTVLVQAAPSIAETDYLLAIAAASPSVAAVTGWIDFADPTHARHLARWARTGKLRAVRPMLQDIADTDWILARPHAWALDALIDHDIAFEFLGRPRHLDACLELGRAYPKLQLVVDHGMKPQIARGVFEPWAQKLKAIADSTDAMCKLSGLASEAAAAWTSADLKPYADHIIASFRPERVMWGSDWPVLEAAGGYDRWRSATLDIVGTGAGADAILGGTACRFYRIPAERSLTQPIPRDGA